jgi:protein-disulfide isomerase
MTVLRRRTLALLAAPLALALAACGGGSDDATGSGPTGEPIPTVAAPAGQSWVETAVETPEGGVRIGNPEAPLKLVEYASHTCHVCADFSKEGAAELEEYVASGRVSYEIRNLIRDSIDLTIAMLARCGEPTVFHPLANQAWQNFDPLMASVQSNPAALEQASQAPPAQRLQAIGQAAGLIDFFAERGISRDQAMQCLADTEQAQQIATMSQQQSDELQLTGTPTFILNGTKLTSTSWGPARTATGTDPGLEAALQQAGAR